MDDTSLNQDSSDNPPQKSFGHYVIQMALDQIDALSDSLIAIQASKYAVEKNTIASLAFLIREKTQNIKTFMEDMAKEKRAIVPEQHPPVEVETSSPFNAQPGQVNLLFEAMLRWYERNAAKWKT